MVATQSAGEGSRAVDGDPIPRGPVVTALAVDQGETTSIVLAATTGLWRTTDAGRSWEVIGDLPPAGAFEALALSSRFAVGRTLYAVAGGDLLRSRDGGSTWQVVLTGSPVVCVATAD